MPVGVTVAGRVSIRTDDVLVDEERFPGRQGRLVFAYLVAEHGKPVLRDDLAEAIWSERPIASTSPGTASQFFQLSSVKPCHV